jgi:PAS domain S-box-containing protein
MPDLSKVAGQSVQGHRRGRHAGPSRGVAKGRLQTWLAYGVAVFLTLGVLLLRLSLGPPAETLPLLIVFVIPIIASAYLGGLGPGLVSTALAALCTDYFLLPPYHSLWIERPVNFLQWLILILEGTLLSALIEALHRSQRRLAASHEQLLALVQQAPIGIAMFDRSMRYLATSRQWLAEFARGRTDLIGLDYYEVYRDVPARWKEAHQKGLAGMATRDDDDVLVEPDGRQRWLRWSVHPWRNVHDEIGGIIIYAEDITVRKRADELQLQSQKLEALGTLSGGIAHDFNNILLAIKGNTSLAVADLAPEHPAQVSLAEIAKAGERATHLVRRILAFSRPQERTLEVLHLRPVIEEAIQLLRATLPAMIEIRSQFAADAPVIAADATQIHQIVVNLGTNAAHAIGERSGVIELRVEGVTVGDDFGASPELAPGRYTRLSVSDDGSGMDRATMERIFDPFFTTKPPGEGTGLGLSVVYSIMKSCLGAVTVYSALGKGTTFHLYFPATAGALDAPLANATPTARGRGETIMYVDDDKALVLLVVRVLKKLGYEVGGYTDSAAALADFRLQPGKFDAVVTDLSMPDLSGFDLARELRAIRPDVPIIMTSGYARPQDQEAAARLGIVELILKPDTVDELGRALDRLFRPESSNAR